MRRAAIRDATHHCARTANQQVHSRSYLAGRTLDSARALFQGPECQDPSKRSDEAARALGVEVQVLEVRQPNELPTAFSALTTWRAGVFGAELTELARLSVKHRVPAMYAYRDFATRGGLLTYGPNFSDIYRRWWST